MVTVYLARHLATDQVVVWGRTRESVEAAITACRMRMEHFDVEPIHGGEARDFIRGRNANIL